MAYSEDEEYNQEDEEYEEDNEENKQEMDKTLEYEDDPEMAADDNCFTIKEDPREQLEET